MTLEERVEKLERANRRMKRILIGLAGVAVTVLIMGQSRPGESAKPAKVQDVIRARSIEVVGAGGKTIIRLKADGQGNGTLTVGDKQGRDLVVLHRGEQEGWGTLTLYYDKPRQPGAVLSAHDIQLFNEEGNRLLIATRTGEDKAGCIELSSRRGTKLIALTTARNTGNGVVTTYDTSGRETASLPR